MWAVCSPGHPEWILDTLWCTGCRMAPAAKRLSLREEMRNRNASGLFLSPFISVLAVGSAWLLLPCARLHRTPHTNYRERGPGRCQQPSIRYLIPRCPTPARHVPVWVKQSLAVTWAVLGGQVHADPPPPCATSHTSHPPSFLFGSTAARLLVPSCFRMGQDSISSSQRNL